MRTVCSVHRLSFVRDIQRVEADLWAIMMPYRQRSHVFVSETRLMQGTARHLFSSYPPGESIMGCNYWFMKLGEYQLA